MNKLFLTLVGVGSILCASPAMAHKASIHDPPYAHRPHTHRRYHGHHNHHHRRGVTHNHCHYHSRPAYSHCHKHSHNGPGRGHHGKTWYHSTPYQIQLFF